MMRWFCFGLALGAAFFFSFRVGRNNPDPPRSAWQRGLRAAAVLLIGLGLFGVAEKAYFYPRYGGWAGYLTEGWMAGSLTHKTEGDLRKLQADLSLWYGDKGKFPATLDLLERNPLPSRGPWPPHAEVFLEVNNRFKRAHWFCDTNHFKYFSSRTLSDDSGGWGYVNDPRSPEWGTVFVNCTHLHFEKRVPWNLSSTVARSVASEAEPQTPTDALTSGTR
ncbi:MAG: hypothetical protein IPP35_05450 [Elusimicrobia bacterium]|nr:hypothetical protein [Elusimicrobiota bacterium]